MPWAHEILLVGALSRVYLPRGIALECGAPPTNGSSPSAVGISQPENLVKDMRKLTIDPSAKKPPASLAGLKLRRRSLRIRCHAIKMRTVENKSEKILREVQSAFPKRRVRTLLSVQNDPVAKMKRLMRVSCICGQGYWLDSSGNLWGVTLEFPHQSSWLVTSQSRASLSYLQLSSGKQQSLESHCIPGWPPIQSTNLPLIPLKCWDSRVLGYLTRLT